MLSIVIKAATALLAASPVVTAQAFAAGQLVKTTSGAIVGRASSWRPGVSEYLGIPFAAPPVGELRWAPPQAFKGAGRTIEATKYVSSLSSEFRGASELRL
jgi:hypothetical protein